jgi:hypothetical protein
MAQSAPQQPANQPQQPPATPQRPATVEERIATALSENVPSAEPPKDPPREETGNDETIRQGAEPADAGPAAPAEAQDGPASGEPEAGGESASSGEEGGEDTVEIGTLSELAEHIGVEVEDLYHITVPVPVGDGKQEISIGEWKDRIKAGIDAEQVSKERETFAQEQRAVAQELAAKRAQVEQGVAQAAALTQAAEKRLLSDMESIDWNALRSEDPAEWSAKRTELQARQGQIQRAKEDLQKAWAQHAEAQRAEDQANLAQHIERERGALLKAVPDWADQKAFESERADMRTYLLGAGFTDEDIEHAVDHRLIVMARKAMLFDRAEAQKSVARKKVAKIGKKVLRPGATTGKQAAIEDADAQLRAAHKKAGKIDSAAQLIAARMRR